MERLMPQPAPGVAAYRREREFLQDRSGVLHYDFFSLETCLDLFFGNLTLGGIFYRKFFLGGGNSNMFYFHPWGR